jgi:hypothetical protein
MTATRRLTLLLTSTVAGCATGMPCSIKSCVSKIFVELALCSLSKRKKYIARAFSVSIPNGIRVVDAVEKSDECRVRASLRKSWTAPRMPHQPRSAPRSMAAYKGTNAAVSSRKPNIKSK